jgi:hypothetical protein
LDRKPDAIFVVGTVAKASSPDEVLQPGFDGVVATFNEQGIEVVAIRDNPRFNFNMAECVILNGTDAPQCLPDRSTVFADPSPFDQIDPIPPGLFLVDLSDSLCTPQYCPGVVGNMFVYIDDNHLTKTYSATIGPTLETKILGVTGWSADP